jgi:hypothetical protein
MPSGRALVDFSQLVVAVDARDIRSLKELKTPLRISLQTDFFGSL